MPLGRFGMAPERPEDCDWQCGPFSFPVFTRNTPDENHPDLFPVHHTQQQGKTLKEGGVFLQAIDHIKEEHMTNKPKRVLAFALAASLIATSSPVSADSYADRESIDAEITSGADVSVSGGSSAESGSTQSDTDERAGAGNTSEAGQNTTTTASDAPVTYSGDANEGVNVDTFDSTPDSGSYDNVTVTNGDSASRTEVDVTYDTGAAVGNTDVYNSGAVDQSYYQLPAETTAPESETVEATVDHLSAESGIYSAVYTRKNTLFPDSDSLTLSTLDEILGGIDETGDTLASYREAYQSALAQSAYEKEAEKTDTFPSNWRENFLSSITWSQYLVLHHYDKSYTEDLLAGDVTLTIEDALLSSMIYEGEREVIVAFYDSDGNCEILEEASIFAYPEQNIISIRIEDADMGMYGLFTLEADDEEAASTDQEGTAQDGADTSTGVTDGTSIQTPDTSVQSSGTDASSDLFAGDDWIIDDGTGTNTGDTQELTPIVIDIPMESETERLSEISITGEIATETSPATEESALAEIDQSGADQSETGQPETGLPEADQPVITQTDVSYPGAESETERGNIGAATDGLLAPEETTVTETLPAQTETRESAETVLETEATIMIEPTAESESLSEIRIEIPESETAGETGTPETDLSGADLSETDLSAGPSETDLSETDQSEADQPETDQPETEEPVSETAAKPDTGAETLPGEIIEVVLPEESETLSETGSETTAPETEELTETSTEMSELSMETAPEATSEDMSETTDSVSESESFEAISETVSEISSEETSVTETDIAETSLAEMENTTEGESENLEEMTEGESENLEPVSESETESSSEAVSETVSETATDSVSEAATEIFERETEDATEDVTENESENLEPETEGESENLEEMTEGESENLEDATEAESENLEAETENESENVEVDLSEMPFLRSVLSDGVLITVAAEEGVFPENATLSVTPIEGESDHTDETKKVAVSYTFDIKILDEDGNEIEPDNSKGKVYVAFASKEVTNENLTGAIYHQKDDGNEDALNAQSVPTEDLVRNESGSETDIETAVTPSDEETERQSDDSAEIVSEETREEALVVSEDEEVQESASEGTAENDETSSDDDSLTLAHSVKNAGRNALTLDIEDASEVIPSMSLVALTDGFSRYTVEFTYDLKTYVLEGDESVSLKEVLAELGFIFTEESTITDVQGSNDELFAVLEENGEITITALQAFTSTESLTFTLDGITYELVVTDDIKNDMHSIDIFVNQMAGGAEQNDLGHWVWTPTSIADGHEFIFRVNYSISGDYELDPGAIEIRIPKSILRNRNKELSDYYEMSIPHKDDYDGSTTLAYYEDGDELVIYNPEEVASGINGYFEVAYVTKEKTYYYRDYDRDHPEDSASDPFTATIKVTNDQGTISADSDKTVVYIDTHARIQSTSKKYPSIIRTWNSEWGDAPDDAGQYYYLVWQIVTYIEDDPTQPYNFSIKDVITDLTQAEDGTLDHDGVAAGEYELIKIKMSGGSYHDYDENDASTYTQYNLTSDGYRYDYVLTRHAIDTYGKISYTLKNTETATVDPIDQVDEDTYKTAPARFHWDNSFYIPTGHFYARKYGNNNWYSRFYHYWDYASYELEEFQKNKIEELTGFAYWTETYGYPYPWTVKSPGDSSNWEDYGYNTVIFDSWDDNLVLESGDQLTSNDYYMSSIDFDVYAQDAEYDDFYQKFQTTSVTYTDDEVVTFYGKFATEENPSGEEILTSFDGSAYFSTASFSSDNLDNLVYDEDKKVYKWSESDGSKSYTVQYNGDGTYTKITWIRLANFHPATESFTDVNTDYVETTSLKTVTDIGDRSYGVQGCITVKDKNMIGWRQTTENRHWYTCVTVVPWVVLKHSTTVDSLVKDKDFISLKNTLKAEMYKDANNDDSILTKTVTYADKDQISAIVGFEKTAIDYARVTYYETELKKKAVTGRNNVLSKEYTIGWKVEMSEKMLVGTGEEYEYLRQDGGTFYDLIPAGGILDKNSIMVVTDEGELSSSDYEYELIENYNGSGRAMFILRVKAPALWFNVFFSTIHPWESISDYGKNALNPVAYETGNEELHDSDHSYNDTGLMYPDNGGKDADGNAEKLSEGNTPYFVDLDPTTDGQKFTYTESSYPINALTAANAGLQKTVMASGDEEWSYATSTKPNGTYMYRWRYQNNYITKATNLIFFDSLENYLITQDGKMTEYSGWRGVLQSIDTTQLTAAGIAPVIYVSFATQNGEVTTEKPDSTWLDTHHDLTNTSDWTLLTDSTDLSKVTAIAIDCRKMSDGTDFVLEAGKSISAYLYFQAPSGIEDDSHPYTYNNIYIQNTLIDLLKTKEDYFIHQDYTQLFFRVSGSFAFYKVNEEDHEEIIPGITFRLYGTSDYGNEIDVEATSDRYGMVTFTDIEKGTYTLIEKSGNDDWLFSDTAREVVVQSTGIVSIDGENVTKTGIKDDESKYLVENTPRIHADVSLYKRDLITTGKYINGVTFRLNGTSDYGTDVLMYYTTENGGKAVFENLEMGTYTLTEIETTDDYILNETSYKVTIDENANVNILKEVKNEDGTSTWETTYDKGKYLIFNEPYHSFRIIKRDGYNYETLEGVKFRLHGTSDLGHPYDETVASTSLGFVDFEKLEAGAYVLEEVEVPDKHTYKDTDGNTWNVSYDEETETYYYLNDNEEKVTVSEDDLQTISYVLDATKYVVEVTEKGGVTIEGLEQNSNGNFLIDNERNKGQITITKKWIDSGDNRPEDITVYISTKKPVESLSRAYFHEVEDGKSIIDYVTSTAVAGIERNITLSEAEVLKKSGVTRIDNAAALWDGETESDTEYPIYAWEENGILYWWTAAEVGTIPANAANFFSGETGLTTINWDGFDTSRYWTGDVGDEALVETCTDMTNIFKGCSGITSLDLSWWSSDENTTMTDAFTGMDSLTEVTLGENFTFSSTSSTLREGNWTSSSDDVYTESELNNSYDGSTMADVYTWSKGFESNVKYAVTIWGIEQDTYSTDGGTNTDTAGLTFGPATGASYISSYISHTPSGATNSGNAHRCLHNDSWSTIAEWSKRDPYVYEDCLTNGCTHSVEICLNDTLLNTAYTSMSGDGAGMLWGSVKSAYRKWNNESNNTGGWPASRIRSTLNGTDSLTNSSVAGTDTLDSSTALISCLESSLQAAIVPKAVKSDTVYSDTSANNVTTYDKLWLFSCIEVWGDSGSNNSNLRPNEGSLYQRSSNKGVTTSNYGALKNYYESGSTNGWWLRSPHTSVSADAYFVSNSGDWNFYSATNADGLAPGFCLA